MSKKAAIVYLKKTGHVLAAATLADEPSANPSVGDLVADALTVRRIVRPPGTVTTLKDEAHIAADHLKPGVVDAKDGLIAFPRGFQVDDPASPAPVLISLPSTANSALMQIDIQNTKLNGKNLTIALAPTASAKLDKESPIWCQVEGKDVLGQPFVQIVSRPYPAGTNSADFPLDVPVMSGVHYLVVVAIQGLPIQSSEITAT